MALLNYSPPMSPYIDILYQDEDILVINKPSGLLTVPGKAPEHRDSVINRVNMVYPTARIVHRLDMATSGLLILAMHKPAQSHLSKQFQARTTQKCYHARIYGTLETTSGTVDLPLICDWPNRPKQMVDHENGKPSQTLWRVLSKTSNTTTVELTPITGRSHQLRVHMLSLGHPILGDRLYAHAEALAMADRLQLHASELSIDHPVTNQRHHFVAPCPFLDNEPNTD